MKGSHLYISPNYLPSLGQEYPLEKEIAIHSSMLAWEIPQAEKPGGQQSMGLRGESDMPECAHEHTHTHTHTHTLLIEIPFDTQGEVLPMPQSFLPLSNQRGAHLWKVLQPLLRLPHGADTCQWPPSL